MIYFLYVPVESGKPEMAALQSTSVDDAVREAEALPYAGRVGYLFDGDLFVQEVRTADLMKDAPLPGSQVRRRRVSAPPVSLAPRPG